MYKDKDRQREANRERQRRYKAKQKALPNQGVTEQGVTEGMTGVFKDKGRYKIVSDAEFTRLIAQAAPGHVRVSKPGDADYEPQCETTRAFIEIRNN